MSALSILNFLIYYTLKLVQVYPENESIRIPIDFLIMFPN